MKKKILITLYMIAVIFFAIIIIYKTADPYTVTFNMNTTEVSGVSSMGASAVHKKGLPVPERDGWTFVGWYTDNQTWLNKFNPDDEDFPHAGILTGNIQLYARWGKDTCTVKFDVLDGIVVSGETEFTVNSGETVRSPEVRHSVSSKVFAGWYTESRFINKWNGDAVYDDTTLYAKWDDYYDSSLLVLPKMYITTQSGNGRINHGQYSSASISLTYSTPADSNSADSGNNFSDVEAQIKGRGNSTWWEFDKKPYRIKFTKKIDLFGMGARKDWILLANAMDHSLMRNYLTFTMANEFGDPYTSQSQWVHIFIDGDYRGVYLLCEQTESGQYRVDIETEHTADDVDVGFLIEYGGSADVDDNKFFRFNSVSGKNIIFQMTDHNAVIKYPKGEECTKAQRDYIAKYSNEVNTAIMKRKWEDIISLVDIGTFVDNFIVTEIMLNNDMGWNFFFYKPSGGKLCLGPHWDFDQAAGASDYGGETYEGWSAGSPHPWFEALVQIDEFIAVVRERWIEKYDYIHSIPDTFIDEKAAEYQYDINANFTRWEVLGKPHWRSVRSLDKETTYQGHIDYLKTWLTNRIDWIEKEIGVK